MPSDTRLTDGQFDFSGGVDSSKTPLLASTVNPKGLARNKLAWLVNGTVRGGPIAQRGGWQPVCTISDGTKLYQGGIVYDQEPLGLLNPYLLLAVGGEILQVRLDTDNSVINLTQASSVPAFNGTIPQSFFVQGERFAVIQPGDFATLPLIWDGAVLTQSPGIISPQNVPGAYPLGQTPFNGLPAGGPMVYYMGRIWYVQPDGRSYAAGDIVGSRASGTAPYFYTDSILRVTESPLALGGDGFRLPGMAGNIRALSYPVALDTALGEGPLFIFTSKQIYCLTVPVDRTAWIATTADSQPLQRVVMNNNGAVGERTIVAVNGDLWYQSLDPAIRSFFMALRYFQTWGNTPVSNPVNRVLAGNDRNLMHLASAMQFNSRMFQGVLPVMTSVGVACQSVAVMDMDPLSTLDEQEPPEWEGTHEGLNWLQFFTGDFGGRERAFAVVQSQVDGTMQLWEYADGVLRDNGDNRITTYIEFPQFDWGSYPRAQGGGPFELKRLDGLDLWVDQVFGTVDLKLQFRVDDDSCLYDWGVQQICAARSSDEAESPTGSYPPTPYYPQFKVPITFGPPPHPPCGLASGRPVNYGYRFQPVLTIKGTCRVRGYHIHAIPKQTAPFAGKLCTPGFFSGKMAAANPPPAPVPPTPPPTPPPTLLGYSVDNWPGIVSAFDLGSTCAASSDPAWNGQMLDTATNTAGSIAWYFTSQSILGHSVAANDTPGWPTPDNWIDPDCWTGLWKVSAGSWGFQVYCSNCAATQSWLYSSSPANNDPNDPSGTYVLTFSSGGSPPASIHISKVFS